MSGRDSEREEPMIIGGASELMFLGTRRSFLRRVMAGGTVLLMPSVFTGCDVFDDGDGDGDNPLGPTTNPVTGLTLDLRSDVGIFRLLHIQEQLESAFYTAVVGSSAFAAMSAEERELFTDLRDVEVVHREFVSAALGAQAVPDIRGSIDVGTLNNLLSSRNSIVQTAKMLEHTGLAALNGAGKYLQDVRNLLVAGKLASVEARHAAALRDILPPAGQNANQAFAGDDITDASGRDVKIEAGVAVDRQRATGLLRDGTYAAQPIVQGPTPQQGVATPDLLPATV